MITLHDRMARGRTETGLIEARHTFSFGQFLDPDRMGFRSLRVLNEDRIVPGAGFPAHPHAEMEILTYVLSGAVEHRDSLGNAAVIRAGDLQRMTAGIGITHAEMNPSATGPLHLLQIWIHPDRNGLAPGYEQLSVGEGPTGGLQLVAGPEAGGGVLRIHQDARLFIARLAAGETVEHLIAPGRAAFVQLTRGVVALDGHEMREGDGAAVEGEPGLRITAETEAEVLLFDLA
ncbi:pirin family protein [Inquilinus limosus]|uniref:Quercetin 2,3-dioxygenase n=1 Tax=Inquilinus limosus MP06 TaxID=1398085 RepID=A0A0A0D6A7_9PROT|nr:pirin family protein [Inquilinus limosus]KGM33639.1 quercetin 2,3-dioxygenase [Inquilinus limosus MP06]